MENIFVEFLPPWVETGLQPAFYDKESGTVLQQTARMYSRVNMLIRMFNKLSKNTKTTVEDYIERFNTLYTYVHDYFDNLDVQEEINNKLDAMVEDGTLGDIIQNFLNLQLSYQTIDDLKADTAIGVGQRVICYGSESVNDGYGGSFIITENSGDILLDNGLYATYLNNYLDNFVEGITYTRTRVSNTDVYITNIPYNDPNGNRIDLSIGAASTNPREMPQEYARRTNTTLTINCSTQIYDYATSTNYDLATLISDGQIILNEDLSGEPIPSNYVYIGFEADRTVHEYPVGSTNGQQMLNDGCVTAFACYWKLVENSQAVDLTGVLPGTTVVTDKNPRNAIGIKADKTIVIVTCDGRTPESHGLTSADLQQIFIDQGCVKAWNLDGGRSTTLVYKGTKINRDIATAGTADVFIDYLLSVKAPNRSKDLSNIYAQIGEVKNLLQDQLTESMIKNRDYSDKNLNTLSGQNILGICNRPVNGPTDQNGYIINIPNAITQNLGKYDKQLFFDSYYELMYTRHNQNGVWSDWQCINAKPSMNVYADDNSNTITTTHVYQSVVFPKKTDNSNVTRSMITIDDTNTYITVNKSCYVKFWFTATFVASTAGTKYVRLYNGDGYQVGPTVNVTAAQGQTVPISFFFMNANGTVNGTTNKYHFEIYGEENDRLHRLSCIVETDR